MTESDAQSYVSLEDFSGLTNGNKVEEGATAWSRAACACDAGLHKPMLHVTYTSI